MVRSLYFFSSSSTPRGKSFLSVLRRTRNIVNKIVKPHPSFEFPRSPSPQPSPTTHTTRNASQLSNTGWNASNVSAVGWDNQDVNSDLASVLSPYSQHIPDRSDRYQGTIGSSGRISVLRRTKGTIRSPSSTHDENVMNFLTPSLAEYRPSIATVVLSEPYHPRHKPLTPIPEQADSPDLASKILLSRSSTDSLTVSSADSAIHFVDEASGTIISRIHRASGSRVSAEQFVLEPSGLKSSLSLHIGSPPSSVCATTDTDAHIEPLPSFVLTLPTPVSPQSNFTTEKLLNAAEAAAPGDRVSSFPQCDHLLSGKLCHACETQMLACRVWLQNTDRGAQAVLCEPLIRSTQSTTRTRAVLASSMGVGASYPPGVGLGLTEPWNEGGNDQDDEDDIDDPGSLAIEAPIPQSSRLTLLSQRAKAILRKVRAGFGLLFPSLLTSPLGNTYRKPA